MKHNQASYSLLFSELKADMDLLENLLEKNRLLTGKIENINPDEFDLAALGYTIHNIYNLMENYFLRVAKFFENNIDQDGWHRNLTDRMALNIPEIRPALLEPEDLSSLHDLRSFRHVFRNIYQGQLNEEKLLEVNRGVPDTIARFSDSHTRFLDNLRIIATELT